MNRRDALKRTALIMGYAVSASTIAGVMQGCSASGDPEWMPTYLTKEQSDLVAEIAEVIIPKTDTPGAKDVGVHEFIDTMFGEFMEEDEKKMFTEGLATVDAKSQSAHSKNFVDLSTEQKDALLREIAAESEPDSFFGKIKELTTTGFFTSEEIGKNVLNYDPIPGDYKGCVDIEEVGNVNWTSMR